MSTDTHTRVYAFDGGIDTDQLWLVDPKTGEHIARVERMAQCEPARWQRIVDVVATAPEALEALREALPHVAASSFDPVGKVERAIRAVIAKATNDKTPVAPATRPTGLTEDEARTIVTAIQSGDVDAYDLAGITRDCEAWVAGSHTTAAEIIRKMRETKPTGQG